jgi:S-adenosylmethionine decarboxylase
MHLTQQIVDVSSPRHLDDTTIISEFLRDLVRSIGMTILAGPLVTREEGSREVAGCSGVVILHESHAAIHTYPHVASAFVDVFSCRRFEAAAVSQVLTTHFGAHEIAEQGLTDRGLHWSADLAAELGGWRRRR